jgi:hypothetical protein
VFIIKIIVISENRRLATVRSNKYNLKYPTINVYTSDLNVWFTKALETETIHIKSKENIFHTITVEVIDENTRNYYMDERKFNSLDELWKSLNFLPIIDNNKVMVCDTTKGEPIHLINTIQELKKK